MQVLRFVRGEKEYRQVSIKEDGSYRIWAMTGGLGKVHENFNEYYKHLLETGWRKASLDEMLRDKYL